MHIISVKIIKIYLTVYLRYSTIMYQSQRIAKYIYYIYVNIFRISKNEKVFVINILNLYLFMKSRKNAKVKIRKSYMMFLLKTVEQNKWKYTYVLKVSIKALVTHTLTSQQFDNHTKLTALFIVRIQCPYQPLLYNKYTGKRYRFKQMNSKQTNFTVLHVCAILNHATWVLHQDCKLYCIQMYALHNCYLINNFFLTKITFIYCNCAEFH